jgi:hypothetical protein
MVNLEELGESIGVVGLGAGKKSEAREDRSVGVAIFARDDAVGALYRVPPDVDGLWRVDVLPVEPACEVDAEVVPDPDPDPDPEDIVLVLLALSLEIRSRAFSASTRLLRLAFRPIRMGLGPSFADPPWEGVSDFGLTSKREVDF